jgi:MFS family permease
VSVHDSRRPLALFTLIAVVSDALLHPFYPRYFAEVFGVRDPRQVGVYIAASTLTVLLALPVWARVTESRDLRHVLLGTQAAAGLLSLVCAYLTSYAWFWLVSLTMLACKASYLLVYPRALRGQGKAQQIATIGLLAFVAYFGHVLAALLSGATLEWLSPRALFVLMALGDLAQLIVCVVWLRARDNETEATPDGAATATAPPYFVARLGASMFLVYFSAYLGEPFFSSYWREVSGSRSDALAGLVYALPALAAALAMITRRREPTVGPSLATLLLLCALSSALQAVPHSAAVLIGRLAYGWGLFQAMVALDAQLFHFSSPRGYTENFGKAFVFQGLGALCASLSAGTLAWRFHTRSIFLLAALGFVLSTLAHRLLFRRRAREVEVDPCALPNQGALP